MADLYYGIRAEQPFLVETVSDSLGAYEVPALYHAGNTAELQNGTKLLVSYCYGFQKRQ